jgi:hypothetical protein
MSMGHGGRADDLTTELPDLLAVLSVRLGPIDRVLYKFSDWAKAPTKLATGGRTVRLDGYRLQPPNTVEVLGLNRNRIALLVVPPRTDPDHAHATMMAAAGPNNVSTVGGLFMAGEPDRETGTQTAAAQERWDSEGGAERYLVGADDGEQRDPVWRPASHPADNYTLGADDSDV